MLPINISHPQIICARIPLNVDPPFIKYYLIVKKCNYLEIYL